MSDSAIFLHKNEVRDILDLPYEDRAYKIISHDHSDLLTRAIPPEELFLIIKSSDDSEIMTLMEYMSSDQLSFILDLDLWSGDRFDIVKFKKWIQYLSFLDYDLLLNYLQNIDLEILALGFSFIVRIEFLLEDNDNTPMDGDTLDGIYFFKFSESWARSPFLKILTIIKAELGNLYFHFLISIFGGIRSEVELDEFKLRNSRLTGLGFPDYEYAITVYKGLSKKELFKQPQKDHCLELNNYTNIRKESGFSEILPRYTLIITDRKKLLFDSLCENLDDVLSSQTAVELAYITNCLIVASSVKDIDHSTVKLCIIRAKSLISLAIDLLTGEDSLNAERILKTFYLKSLFQYAFYKISKLKETARKIMKSSSLVLFCNEDELYEFLGKHLGAVIKGVLLKVPMVFVEGERKEHNYEDFRNLSDFYTVRDVLDGIGFLLKVFHDLFKISATDLYCFYKDTKSDIHICFSTLFFRMMFNNEAKIQPFCKSDLVEMINTIRKEKKVFEQFRDKIIEYISREINGFKHNKPACLVIDKAIMDFYDEIKDLRDITEDKLCLAVSSIAYTG